MRSLSKIKKVLVCCFIPLSLSVDLYAQNKPSFSLSSKQIVSRTGYFGGMSAGILVGRLEIEAGTGVNWLRLFQYGHYAPYIDIQLNVELIQKERLSILTGLDYMMTLRRFPTNTASSANTLYYHYKLKYGKKWQFIQELGVGGTVLNRFPESNQLIWDVKMLIGVGYAF